MIHLNTPSFLTIASLCSFTLLLAADTFWDTKTPSAWTEADAKQILTNSPWAKEVTGGVARRLTEDQLREGGVMGQPHGVGYDGVDPKGSGPSVSWNILSGPGGDDRSQRSRPGSIPLSIRWESAMPVRLAELKAQGIESATLPGDGYQIAVFGVPGLATHDDPAKLGDPLKRWAALKRDGKKDVKPDQAAVFPGANGLTLVYLFPVTAEIVEKDGWVVFEAQIGRISVSHGFELQRMKFLWKLVL
jgi:hypothetical protein